MQGANALSQVGQQPGHQPFTPALAEVRIPAADVDGGRLEADLGPDKRRHLPQAQPKSLSG